jgi:hypothetical protein
MSDPISKRHRDTAAEEAEINRLWAIQEEIWKTPAQYGWAEAHEAVLVALRAQSARWAAEWQAEEEARSEWEYAQRDLGWGVDPAPNKVDLVVTRHHSLVLYLIEKGYADASTQVLSHVTDGDTQLRGRRVAGVLPLNLAAMCCSVVVVELDLPANKRGVELSLEEMREFARDISTFTVNKEESR